MCKATNSGNFIYNILTHPKCAMEQNGGDYTPTHNTSFVGENIEYRNIKMNRTKKTVEEIETFVDQLKSQEGRKEIKIPTKPKKKKEKTSIKDFFTLKKVIAIITSLTIILLLLFFVILPTMQGSIHFLVVLSGSMSPEANPGDIVVSTYIKPEEIKVNDIISFSFEGKSENCITHRVINITTENSSLCFQTKGDANEEPDLRIVKSGDIIGKVSLIIPYLGYVPHFANTPLGFLTLIFIPGILIIIFEIRNIIKNKDEKPGEKKVKKKFRIKNKVKEE